MPHIDLNCDLGESFGAYTIGMDEKVIPFITSPMWPVGSMQAIRW